MFHPMMVAPITWSAGDSCTGRLSPATIDSGGQPGGATKLGSRSQVPAHAGPWTIPGWGNGAR